MASPSRAQRPSMRPSLARTEIGCPSSAGFAAGILADAVEPVRRSTRRAIGQFMLESLEQRQMLTRAAGVDVSHYQGTINWTSVHNAGKSFAYQKATEGVGITDATLATNMSGGTAAGLLMGVYHIATPSTATNDAVNEANYFVQQASQYMTAGYLPPALDLVATTSFTAAAMTTWVNTFEATVKNATGVDPLVFTNNDYVTNHLTSGATSHPLWIIRQSTAYGDPTTTGSPPTGVWGTAGKTWQFWQYSATGTVAGISGSVDLDSYTGTLAALQASVVSPTVTLVGAPGTLNEGATYTLTRSGSNLALSGGSKWTVNWGDGSAPQDVAGTATTVTHVYGRGTNVYSVSATATENGITHAAANTLSVTVNDVTPVVTAPSTLGPATVGATFRAPLATFADAGFGLTETFIASIDWGDGTAPSAGTVRVTAGTSGSGTQGTVVGQHVYATAGNYTVAVTLTDGGGLSGTASVALAAQAQSGATGSAPAQRIYTGLTVYAQDPNNGNTGRLGDGVLVQPDGKVVVVGKHDEAGGNYVLQRYNADGTPDLTFGTNGEAPTALGSGGDENSLHLALQPVAGGDFNILASGFSTGIGNAAQLTVARFTSSGQADGAFGTNGKVVTDLFGHDLSNQLLVLAGGAAAGDFVLLGASTYLDPSTSDPLRVEYYHADGTLDTTFGQGGGVTTDLAAYQRFGASVQGDGALVLGGWAYGGSAGPQFTLYRYLCAGAGRGQLDTAFGTNGKQVVGSFVNLTGSGGGTYDDVNAVIVQGTGASETITVGGETQPGTSLVFAIDRFDGSGQPIATFGNNGSVVTSILADGSGWPTNLAVQVDGKVLAAGAVGGANGKYDVVRYGINGQVDATFNAGAGVLHTGFYGGNGTSDAFTLDATGGFYLAGQGGAASPDGELALYHVDASGAAPSTPYRAVLGLVPGTIQAEDYDVGGEGVAYHDTTGTNEGGAYRPSEGVDLTALGGGGYAVTATRVGEWLKYSVNVAATGTYDLNVRVASPGAGASFHLELDGVDVTGSVAVPDTGTEQAYTTVTRPGLAMTQGKHVLRLVMDSAAASGACADVDYLTLVAVRAHVTSAHGVMVNWTAGPGGVTADHFQLEASSGGSAFALVLSVSGDATAHLVTGLDAGTTYAFRVDACDAAGNVLWSGNALPVTTATVDTTGWYQVSSDADPATGVIPFHRGSAGDVSVGQNLHLEGNGIVLAGSAEEAILLAVRGSVVNQTQHATFAVGVSGAIRFDGSQLDYEDRYGMPGSDYDYNDGYVLIGATPTSAPTVSHQLVATASADSPDATLSWSEDASATGGFTIDASTDDGQTFSTLATVGAGVQSYTASNLSEDATYTFNVYPTGGSTSWASWARRLPYSSAPVTMKFISVLQESVQVPVDGSTVAMESALVAGASYRLTASGLIYNGDKQDGLADAEYSNFYNGVTSAQDKSLYPGHADYGIAINDPTVGNTKTPFWGPPNLDHVYTIGYTGAGAPLSFNYHDDFPNDNHALAAGGLTVDVYRIYLVRSDAPPGSWIDQVPGASLLSANPVSANEIDLSWTQQVGSNDSVVLERSPSGDDGTWQTIATPYTSGSYADVGLSPNTTYYYRLSTTATSPVYHSNIASATTDLLNGAPGNGSGSSGAGSPTDPVSPGGPPPGYPGGPGGTGGNPPTKPYAVSLTLVDTGDAGLVDYLTVNPIVMASSPQDAVNQAVAGYVHLDESSLTYHNPKPLPENHRFGDEAFELEPLNWNAVAQAYTGQLKVRSDADAGIHEDFDDAVYDVVAAPAPQLHIDTDFDGKVDSASDDPHKVDRGGIVVADKDNVYADPDQPARRKEMSIGPGNPDTSKAIILQRTSDSIRIFDAKTGGNEIKFTNNVSDPIPAATWANHSLWVQGGSTPSQHQADQTVTLLTDDKKTTLDKVTFTVLWVATEGRTFGSAPIDGKDPTSSITSSYPISDVDYTRQLGVFADPKDINGNRNVNVARSTVELIGALSVDSLDLGQQIPVGLKNNSPSAGRNVVQLGFNWERRTTSRLFADNNANPQSVQDEFQPLPGPYTNVFDDSLIVTERGKIGQDSHPDPDATAGKRLVIEDFDAPSTPFAGNSTRSRNRVNAQEWVTLTLAAGAADSVAASVAERCSDKIKWSTETDISKNAVVDPTKIHYDYNGGRNTGMSPNEVYIGKWVPLTLDKQPPQVVDVTSNHGPSGHPLAGEVITGSDFDVGATVVISKGASSIVVSNVQASLSQITFDTSLKVNDAGALKNADAGLWTLKVINSDGTASNGVDFTVE